MDSQQPIDARDYFLPNRIVSVPSDSRTERSLRPSPSQILSDSFSPSLRFSVFPTPPSDGYQVPVIVHGKVEGPVIHPPWSTVAFVLTEDGVDSLANVDTVDLIGPVHVFPRRVAWEERDEVIVILGFR